MAIISNPASSKASLINVASSVSFDSIPPPINDISSPFLVKYNSSFLKHIPKTVSLKSYFIFLNLNN